MFQDLTYKVLVYLVVAVRPILSDCLRELPALLWRVQLRKYFLWYL